MTKREIYLYFLKEGWILTYDNQELTLLNSKTQYKKIYIGIYNLFIYRKVSEVYTYTILFQDKNLKQKLKQANT